MIQVVKNYMNWLHTRWPAGTVEKLPEVDEQFATNVKGVYVVGDLTGIPLLKLSADSGVKAVRNILADSAFQKRKKQEKDGAAVHDLVIIGGGVAGHAAALEARNHNLDYVLLEAAEPFSTIVNFPKGKPIYTYPTEMKPEGDLQFEAKIKEPLVEEIRQQTRDIEVRIGRAEKVNRTGGLLEVPLAGDGSLWAHRVIVAIGRSGNFRKLGVPGEDSGKVYNRLHDPKEFKGRDVLVVGGGDSALETAIALAECGARVTLSYRKQAFSRPKPDNIEALSRLEADPHAHVAVESPSSDRVTTAMGDDIESYRKPGSIVRMMGSSVKGIEKQHVTLNDADGTERTLPNDVVFSMIGREAPLDFFRRSGVNILGESRPAGMIALVCFAIFIFLVYDWKGESILNGFWKTLPFPANVDGLLSGLGGWWAAQVADRSGLIGTLAVSMKSRSFYYTLVYTTCIGIFGWQRIRRRNTPYVTRQTVSLFLIQLFPLFLLPEVILPLMDYNGFFQSGLMRTVADGLFELYIPVSDYASQSWPDWGHPRAYWRAYGFILAWPLNVYNMNTHSPLPWWLVIGSIQTFVIIPYIVYRWGKGAYCGWICSCGGLAETMGDNQRHKMPHGPKWNRLNMIGQVFLTVATMMLLVRVFTWIFPNWGISQYIASHYSVFMDGKVNGTFLNPLSYKWFVDILFGGFIGVAFYFKYSGRVWCRFACPLAALMHIYARFSKFRIIPEKKKCISCNVCTSVCHQGIDVMNFANKGMPMEDPQCVRCSACVQSCPTGVLQFGQVDPKTGQVLGYDRLPASPVLMREGGMEV